MHQRASLQTPLGPPKTAVPLVTSRSVRTPWTRRRASDLAVPPQARPDRFREQSYRESEDDPLFELRASDPMLRWNFDLDSKKDDFQLKPPPTSSQMAMLISLE